MSSTQSRLFPLSSVGRAKYSGTPVSISNVLDAQVLHARRLALASEPDDVQSPENYRPSFDDLSELADIGVAARHRARRVRRWFFKIAGLLIISAAVYLLFRITTVAAARSAIVDWATFGQMGRK